MGKRLPFSTLLMTARTAAESSTINTRLSNRTATQSPITAATLGCSIGLAISASQRRATRAAGSPTAIARGLPGVARIVSELLARRDLVVRRVNFRNQHRNGRTGNATTNEHALLCVRRRNHD